MTYMDKINKMVKTLEDTEFEMFDGDKDEAMDFLLNELESFPAYVNTVITEQIQLPMLHVRYEGQDYRDAVTKLDRDRRIAHDRAISSVNILNRTSERLGLEPFANIDTSDSRDEADIRHDVANMIGKFVNEVYNNGIGNGFDDAVLKKDSHYDKKVIKDRLEDNNRSIDIDFTPTSIEEGLSIK